MNVLNRQYVNPLLVGGRKGFVRRTAGEEGTGVAADAEHTHGRADGREVEGGDVGEGGGGCDMVWLGLGLGLSWSRAVRVRVRVGVSASVSVDAIAGKGEQFERTTAVAGREEERAAVDEGKVPCARREVTTATILAWGRSSSQGTR